MANLLPFLLILACPLMMIFMMRGMHGGHGHSAAEGADHHAKRQGDTGVTDTAELDALRADLEVRMNELDTRMEEFERAEEGEARPLTRA